MTRSRIQRIKFFVFLLISLLAQGTVCDRSFRVARVAPDATLTGKTIEGTFKKDSAQSLAVHKSGQEAEAVHTVSASPSDANKTADVVNLQSPGDANKTTHHVKPQKEQHFGEGHGTSLNPGALLRGLYVFVGLSVLVVAYIVFRSFRLSKTRAQMVRKYGVLAHRQDVEMRPLPLEEEDDEDTTVFDASNVLTNNVQHQNL